MNQAPPDEVAAFVLAGGKSTRMGKDKAFVEFEERTLLAWAIDLARSVTAEVRIVGSREKFVSIAPVVEDIFRDCGPLGGIHAALKASEAELNLVLAVDMPFVSQAFLRYLINEARHAPRAAVTIPHADKGWQPLCAIYRIEFADAAEKALRAGQNKIDRLFDEVHTRAIGEDETLRAGFSLDLFRNLNTRVELEREQRRA